MSPPQVHEPRVWRRLAAFNVLVLAGLFASHARVNAQECSAEASRTHAATTVVYSHVSGVQQATAFAPSADGSVQAIDVSTGNELWSFTPPEASSATQGDRITDLRVLRFDANDDGTIDISSGDRVWLYFGLRETGPYYYALDITERGSPRVLWKLDADALDGLADAWSTPDIARVRVGGATQNGEHFVLIFGGGYGQDAGGNRIFMVDAASGRLLWHAGGDAGADLVLPAMMEPLPARVAVLDTDGDAFADRMYAVDVSGIVWRFDVWNGQGRSTLVTGGVFANLSDDGGRFFNAPDVALIQPRGGAPYYNIAVGSGGNSLATGSASPDWFYAVRDKRAFERVSQADYDRAAPIRVDELVEISTRPDGAAAGGAGTSIPTDTAGWKLQLSGVGERVAAESITADGVVLFTTFQPTAGDASCDVGSSRVYAIRIESGTPGLDLNDDGAITPDDIATTLPTTGVPGELRVVLGTPSRSAAGSNGPGDPASPPDQPNASPTQCFVGPYALPSCVAAGALIRTYWQRPAIR